MRQKGEKLSINKCLEEVDQNTSTYSLSLAHPPKWLPPLLTGTAETRGKKRGYFRQKGFDHFEYPPQNYPRQ